MDGYSRETKYDSTFTNLTSTWMVMHGLHQLLYDEYKVK